MKDLSIKEFSNLIYEKIKSLEYETILTKPTLGSVFPCIELHTPLKSINKSEEAFPISSTFQILITCWNEEKKEVMGMTHEVDEKLQQYNILRTITNEVKYDETLKKYEITVQYEVRYNGITDSFNFIK